MLAWTKRLALVVGPSLALVLLLFDWKLAVAGLCATPFILLFRIIYGSVGKRVAALERAAAPGAVHALMVNGMIQAPGLASIDENKIVLHPIVGNRVEIPLADIVETTETFAFNGKAVPGKTAFWFKVNGRKRLGVAVSNQYAADWRRRTRS